MLLNVNNLHGNPFLNFFYQAAVEFPANVIAKWLSNRIGRRSTQTATFLLVSASCFGVATVINSESQRLERVILPLVRLESLTQKL
jgi:hypothetical protein